jgi:hypothetical protein
MHTLIKWDNPESKSARQDHAKSNSQQSKLGLHRPLVKPYVESGAYEE